MVRIFWRRSACAIPSLRRGTAPYEVDTDSGDVGFGIGVVGEAKEQAGLADTGVTDEQQLEEVVVSVGGVSM